MARMTLDKAGSGVRKFNDWLRCKMSETDDSGRKKYRQQDVAEYIGITQPMLSHKMSGKNTWTLNQVLNAVEYFDSSIEEVFR